MSARWCVYMYKDRQIIFLVGSSQVTHQVVRERELEGLLGRSRVGVLAHARGHVAVCVIRVGAAFRKA